MLCRGSFHAVLFAAIGSAQSTNWRQVKPTVSPSARSNHAMAYDGARQRTVLFGGVNGSHLADTWEWDGKSWMQIRPTASPPRRSNHAMVYDSARQRTVLFGGKNTANLADTWQWDGTNWKQLKPTASPAARQVHALAYDSARQRVVLFGGYAGRDLSDTWEWDGRTWTQIKPMVSPPARSGHAMVYDIGRRRTMLFGGTKGNADTWEWDGKVWKQFKPTTSPAARGYHAMAYDSARGRTVMFGGVRVGYFADTWAGYGGGGFWWWSKVSTSSAPSARGYAAMVYDTARRRMVLFGGVDGVVRLADTWEYEEPRSSVNDYYIDPVNGRDVVSGGRKSAPWKTIQYGVQQSYTSASAGNHRYFLAKGRYSELVHFNFPAAVGYTAEFVGVSRIGVVIDGGFSMHLRMKGLTVSNVTCDRVIYDTYHPNGSRSGSLSVSDCRVRQLVKHFSSVSLGPPAPTRITSSRIERIEFLFNQSNSVAGLIQDCQIGRGGISSVAALQSLVLRRCHVEGPARFWTHAGGGLEIEQCVFVGGGLAIDARGDSRLVATMSDCVVTGVLAAGVYFKDTNKVFSGEGHLVANNCAVFGCGHGFLIELRQGSATLARCLVEGNSKSGVKASSTLR